MTNANKIATGVVAVAAVGGITAGAIVNSNKTENKPANATAHKANKSSKDVKVADALKHAKDEKNKYTKTKSAKDKVKAEVKKTAKKSAFTNHLVKAGDTLWGIAEASGVSVDTIIKDNNITDGHSIYVDQVLRLRNQDSKQPDVQSLVKHRENTSNAPASVNYAPSQNASSAQPSTNTTQSSSVSSNHVVNNSSSHVSNNATSQAPSHSTPSNVNGSHSSSDQAARDKAQAEADAKAKQDAINKAKEEAEQAARDKAKAEAELKALNASNATELSNVNAKKEQLNSQVTTLTDAISKLNSAIDQLTPQVTTASTTLATAKSTLDGAQAKLDTAKQKVTDAQTALATANQHLTDAQAKLTALTDTNRVEPADQAGLDAANQAVATAKGEVINAQKTLDTANADLAAVQAEITKQQGAVATAQKTVNDLTAQLSAKKTELADKQAQLKTANDSLANLPTAYTDAKDNARAKELQNQIAGYTKTANDSQAKINQLTDELAKINDEINKLNDEIKSSDAVNNANVTNGVADSADSMTDAVSKSTDKATDDVNNTADSANKTADSANKTADNTHLTPITTEHHVTVYVDEAGHKLTQAQASDTKAYHLMSTSAEVKSQTTDADGNIDITYTTTKTYHKIATINKSTVKYIDETGNTLTEAQANSKDYHLMSSKDADSSTTAENGDVTVTTTTTKTYHKVVTTKKAVTVNQDTDGHVLGNDTDLSLYKKVETKDPVDKTDVADNGDITITSTTVVVYQAIVETTHKAVTVYVDENGNTISEASANSNAYHFMSESSKETSKTVDAHHIEVTKTTTKIYHKIATIHKDKVVYVDEAGNTLTKAQADSDAYHLMNNASKDASTTADNGDVTVMTTTTKTYHKVVTTNKSETINKDIHGNVLGKDTDLSKFEKVETQKPTQKTTVAPNGDKTVTTTTVVIYRSLDDVNHKTVIVYVDENGNKISEADANSNAYHFMSESSKESTKTNNDGTVVITKTTTKVYHKIVTTHKDKTVYVDEAGNTLTKAQADSDAYHLMNTKTGETSSTAKNGDKVVTTTTTNTYHKVGVKEVNDITYWDNDGMFMLEDDDLANYDLEHPVSVEKTADDTITTASNGDKVITHHVDYNVKTKEQDSLTAGLTDANDDILQVIEDQVNNNTRVSIEQSKKLSPYELNRLVTKYLLELVNAKRAELGHFALNAVDNEAGYDLSAERAIEVNTNFSHAVPSQTLPGANYADLGPYSECVTYGSIDVHFPTADALAKGLAQAMYDVYVTREAPENNGGVSGGHYDILINEMNFNHNLAAGVFVIDNGTCYSFSNAINVYK